MQHTADAAAQEQAQTAVPFVLTAARQAAFSPSGPRLPPLWGTPGLAQPPRKALLRCLLDKGALHRVARSQAQVRLVWRGGATTTFLVPVTGKSSAARPRAAAMEPLIHDLFAAGHRDAAMAAR